jgi:hypothetical protein
MKKSLFFIILFVGFLAITVKGQDTLYLKKHKQINVKVLKKSSKSVEYRFSDYPDGPVFSVKPVKISKIVYKNGYTENFGNKNPRVNRPFGVSGGLRFGLTSPGNLGEFGTFIVSFDYFLIPQIDLQLNMGTQFSDYYFYSFGATFHLNKTNSDTHFAPFTGVLLGTDYNYFPMWFIRVPIGVNYVNNWGLSASLSLGSMFYFRDDPLLTVQVKIGWRFK